MILSLSEKLTNIDNLKQLSNSEKELIKKLLYSDAFDYSLNYFSTTHKTEYKESLFYLDSQNLNKTEFDNKVLNILKNFDTDFKDVIIEAPTELNLTEKINIKKELEKEHGYVYPTFKLNTDLLGGIRIYINGKLIDKSWDFKISEAHKKASKVSSQTKEDLKKLLHSISKNIENENFDLSFQDIGVIKSFKDGVLNVEGLTGVKMGEILQVQDSSALALVMLLDSKSCNALVLSNLQEIKEGMYVKSTSKMLSMPVSDKFFGRVLDALGNPIDGGSSVETNKHYPHEKIAPGVMTRKSVSVPLQTGILAIDALIPIGRGQRELIIGDRQTGKSTIAIDTIINQKGKDVICIYTCIGQRESFVANLHETFKKVGALDYTIIVSASASSSAVMQFLAPYGATALAEYFMDQGKDVLIIYDDLSKHAVAYREISLLLRRPPGREAYPGDVFYIHSRLLERSARLNEKNGGGSITSLPIIETQAGDVSAYIPTNVISITDGQIFLETDLFNKGIMPALNVGISVSRVGGSAQTQIMKKTAGTLKLDLATYYELEAFSQFSSDLDETTKKSLNRGKRVVMSLIQDQKSPYQLHEEIFIISAVNEGFLDNISEKEVNLKLSEMIIYLDNNKKDLIKKINDEKKLSDEIKSEILNSLREFFKIESVAK